MGHAQTYEAAVSDDVELLVGEYFRRAGAIRVVHYMSAYCIAATHVRSEQLKTFSPVRSIYISLACRCARAYSDSEPQCKLRQDRCATRCAAVSR